MSKLLNLLHRHHLTQVVTRPQDLSRWYWRYKPVRIRYTCELWQCVREALFWFTSSTLFDPTFWTQVRLPFLKRAFFSKEVAGISFFFVFLESLRTCLMTFSEEQTDDFGNLHLNVECWNITLIYLRDFLFCILQSNWSHQVGPQGRGSLI